MKKLFHVIKLVIFAVTFFSCESSEILSGKVHSENESNSAEIRDTERVLGANIVKLRHRSLVYSDL